MLLSANLLWLLGSGEALSTTGSNVIKLGCSLGYIADDPTLVDYIQAVHLRVKQLNEQNSTLIDSNAKIELVYENHEFDSTKTIQKAISIMNSGVIAAVGAGYSSRTILSSLIWQTVKIPQCDAYASNPSLSNKAAYPNFFRTYPTDKSFADAMLGWILDQGWTKVAIAYTNEDYGNGFATLFTGLARTANLTVLTQQSIELKGTSAKAKDAAYQIKDSGAKIVLYFGYLNEFETLVKEAKALGIWGPGYAWIGTDGLSGVPSAYSGKTDLDGLIYFFPRERANNAAAASFDAYWTANRFSTTNPYANSSALAPGALAYFGATCVDLLMLGLDKLLKSDATYTLSGLVNGTYNEKLKIPDSFRFPTYQSPSGTIISDANGDRIGNFDIFNVKKNGDVQLAGGWSNGKAEVLSEYLYPGYMSLRPKDSVIPAEVAEYIALGDPTGSLAMALFIIGVVSLAIVSLGFIYYRSNVIVKASSFNIGLLQLACILVALVELIVMIDLPTSSKCAADFLLIPFSFSFYYGLVLIKNLRIYKLFRMTSVNVKRWNDFSVCLYASLWFLPTLVAGIVGVAGGSSPQPLMVSAGVYAWTCALNIAEYQKPIVDFLIAYNACLLVANLAVAFLNRNVYSRFNETKLIALTVYNVLIIIVFCLPILFASSLGLRLRATIKVLSIFYVCMFNLFSGFAYKVYQCYKVGDKANDSLKGTDSIMSRPSHIMPKTLGMPATTEVFMKTGSFLNPGSGKFMTAEHNSLVVFNDAIRESFEDKHMKPGAFGTVWNAEHLKVFTVAVEKDITLNFQVNNQKVQVIFGSQEHAKEWYEYFQKWVNKVQAKGTVNGSMLKSNLQ